VRKISWLVAIILILVLLAGLFFIAWARAPRILSVAPAPGSEDISPEMPVKITFSKPVQHDSAESQVKIDPARRGSFSWEGNTLVFTPSWPWPSGEPVSVQVLAGVRSQDFFSLPLLQGKAWSFAVAQRLLAYLWPTIGAADIYVLDPLTGVIRQLTNSQNVLDYSISRDGQQIFYSIGNPDSSGAIYRLQNLESSAATKTFEEPGAILLCPTAACRSPRLSPDGKWLAYERTARDEQGQYEVTEAWLLSLSNGSDRLAGLEGHTTFRPAWSSQGWLSFYDNERQGFVVQDSSGKELAFLPNQTGDSGSWQPDGMVFVTEELVANVVAHENAPAASRLLAYDLTQSDSAGEAFANDLSRAVDLQDMNPVYSPDGAWIAFTRRFLDADLWTPGGQVWRMRQDGSALQQLTEAGDYHHYNLAWSPDGSRLAYVRFNQTLLTETAELWLMNSDGSQPLELVKSGFSPQWIP
jgi:Tol biopolymer transport system component